MKQKYVDLFYLEADCKWWKLILDCRKLHVLGKCSLALRLNIRRVLMFLLPISGQSNPSVLHCAFHMLKYETQGSWSVRHLFPKAASTALPWLFRTVGQSQVCSLGPVINNMGTTGVVARAQTPVCIS